MNKHRRVYAPWQYAIRNVLFGFVYLLGAIFTVGALIGIFAIYQPRILGQKTAAHATKYYTTEGDILNVDYTYSVGKHDYKDTDEVTSKIYAQKPSTLEIWYTPSDPGGLKYVPVSNHYQVFVAIMFLGVGLLLLYSPSMGRRIDRSIEAGHANYEVKGCICGANPKMEIKVNDYRRRVVKTQNVTFAIIIVLVVYVFAADGSGLRGFFDITQQSPRFWLLLALMLYGLWYFISNFIITGRSRMKHTFICRLRQVWIGVEYGTKN